MVRTVDNWMEIIGKANATNESDANAAARRIIGDLIGYAGNGTRQYTNNIDDDVIQLGNALQAYAKLLHKYGGTP